PTRRASDLDRPADTTRARSHLVCGRAVRSLSISLGAVCTYLSYRSRLMREWQQREIRRVPGRQRKGRTMTQQQQWDETRQRVDSEKGKSSSEAIKGSLSDFLSVKRISNVTSMESSAERRGIVESSFGEQEFLGQSVDVGMGVDRDGGILVGRVMREPYNDDDLWFSTPEQGAEGGWGFEDVMAKTPTGPDRRIRTLLPWPTEDPRYQQALEAASTSSSPEGVALRGHLSSVKTEKTEQQWDEARQRAEDVQARRENAVAAEVPY